MLGLVRHAFIANLRSRVQMKTNMANREKFVGSVIGRTLLVILEENY